MKNSLKVCKEKEKNEIKKKICNYKYFSHGRKKWALKSIPIKESFKKKKI